MTFVQTQKLTTKIIQYYVEKEKKCENDYHWYYNNEIDQHMTPFIALSQSKQLGLKTKLCNKDVKIIMYLLGAILQEDNYIMEYDGLDTFLEDNEHDDLLEKYYLDKEMLHTFTGVKMWIKYLKIALEDYDILEYDTKQDSQAIPSLNILECNHNKKQKLKTIVNPYINAEQCILKVDEINNNLRIIKSGIVKIEH
jgi:hypothetical protein